MIDKKVKEQVVSLYNSDTPIKEILRKTGVRSEQTIYRILKENGVQKRGSKKNRVIKITLKDALLDKFTNDSDDIIEKQIISYLNSI